MSRQTLPSGQWFIKEKCQRFDEATNWDGNNHVSTATGSQWDHEALYLTATGKWVANRWSQRQGSTDQYEIVDTDTAARWLSVSGADLDDIDSSSLTQGQGAALGTITGDIEALEV